MLWIKEVEMVGSLEELKSSRSISGKNFPNFKMLGARIASALNKINQISQFKKKVSLEEQIAQKEGRFLRGRQIAFMIYDYFRVTGAHETVLDYVDLFFVTLHVNVQEFGTRWEGSSIVMSKIPSDDVLTQNRVGIVRHGDSSVDIDAQLSKVEDDGEKKHRSETSTAKI